MKPLGEFEVWFVTGSQEMYGEETLRRVAANSGLVARQLDESPAIPVRIVHRPPVTSSESIAATCRAANAADTCVGVILWMHTFSPA
ncbi:MAG: L-arabinose isomerase, partial [Candidatus Limnocylindrales bacterium]